MAWAPFLATLVISLTTLILSGFALWRQASNDWIRQLEKRIDECERDRAKLHEEIAACREQIQKARDREFELMSRLYEQGFGPR